MAISPEKLKEKSLDIINKLEQYFDNKLSYSTIDYRGQCIDIYTTKDIPINAFYVEALSIKYRKAGWTHIKWHYNDKGDNGFIRFFY